jgi:hypothetical protein
MTLVRWCLGGDSSLFGRFDRPAGDLLQPEDGDDRPVGVTKDEAVVALAAAGKSLDIAADGAGKLDAVTGGQIDDDHALTLRPKLDVSHPDVHLVRRRPDLIDAVHRVPESLHQSNDREP